MRNKNWKKEWRVKILRPEEIYSSPNLYYTREEVEKYSKSSSMKKIQQEHTLKIINLLKLEPPARILDLGCGVGFSMEILHNYGFDVIGIDINPYMIEKAREKNLKVILGDFRDLTKYFSKKEFDAIVSISALQWIKTERDMRNSVKGMYEVLKENGRIGIQFYPYSSTELRSWERLFKKYFKNVEVLIENPDNPRKRNIYLIIKKLI